MEKDYYDILSVSKNCSQEDIKKAFRKIALKYHPDRNPGKPEAEKKFKEAANAYDILSNPEKRARYDQFGHEGTRAGFSGTRFNNVEDIFSAFQDIFEGGDIFGGGGSSFHSVFSSGGMGRGFSQRSSGAHLRYHLSVTLTDVLKGCEKTISYNVDRSCEVCNGTGAKAGTKPKECRECSGSGRLTRRQGFFSFASACPTCGGEGKIISSPCGVCFGKARLQKKETLTIDIPPGIETGKQLRIPQKGESGYNGGPTGDLYVEVHVENDPKFERRGADLLSSVQITYLQAILGAQIEAPALGGTKKTVTIPKGAQPGNFVVLKAEGLPRLANPKKKGNMIYHVHITLPKKLKKAEETLLKELKKLQDE